MVHSQYLRFVRMTSGFLGQGEILLRAFVCATGHRGAIRTYLKTKFDFAENEETSSPNEKDFVYQ